MGTGTDDCRTPDEGRELLPLAEAEELAAVFKALADPARVRLLSYLAASDDGTACACHLPEALGISQPTLSHHLKKLQTTGLVTREQRGRWAHYTVQPAALSAVRAYLQLDDRLAAPTGSRCC
ncbi:ArsR/SmtB family transcription factor [Actinomycetota bacterium]|nr:metalloregulator ArsR/SmtB family transcription factor [Micrococcales bacterium]